MLRALYPNEYQQWTIMTISLGPNPKKKKHAYLQKKKSFYLAKQMFNVLMCKKFSRDPACC